MLLDELTYFLLVSRVKERIKFIDHQSAQISNENFFTISSVIESFHSGYQAIDALLKLLCFDLMALTRIYAKKFKRHLIMKRLKHVISHLNSKLSIRDHYQSSWPIR